MFSEIELTRNPTSLLSIRNSAQHCSNKPKEDKKTVIVEKWEWYDCDFVLKQFLNDQPTVSVASTTNPSESLKLRMTMTMEREFDFTNLSGWLWHKTWIIPTITVSLETEDRKSAENFNFPPNTYISLIAVKHGSKCPQKFYLVDVGLQGQFIQEAELGKHVFSGLKFTETSYKHQGSKFNIVVALLLKKQGEAHPLIIDCKISPPIFIDSRRSARDEIKVKDPRSNEVFPPQMLCKTLVKRKKNEEEEITNDSDGFVNYFSAPNIRNKIKNPIFLAYRFSNFISLYYNTVKIGSPNALVETIMEYILEREKDTSKSYFRKSQTHIDKLNPDALLCLVLKRTNDGKQAKEVAMKLGSFDNGLMNLLCDSSLLSKKFVMIEDPQVLRILYEKYFTMQPEVGIHLQLECQKSKKLKRQSQIQVRCDMKQSDVIPDPLPNLLPPPPPPPIAAPSTYDLLKLIEPKIGTIDHLVNQTLQNYYNLLQFRQNGWPFI